MQIIAPRIAEQLKDDRLLVLMEYCARQEESIQGYRFEGQTLEDVAALPVEFVGCHFVRCRFPGCDLHKIQFVDCRFDGCDFSNAVMTEAVMHRVQLQDCKLVGANLSDAYLRNVSLTGCACRYFSLTKANLKAVLFRDCLLDDAIITNSKFQAELLDCSLQGSTWFSTPMKGIDLSRCEIEGIRLTPAELGGAIINQAQAVQLAPFLGVKIKM